MFLEPEPSAMGDYGHRADKVLKENGKNLSGVLFNLCRNEKTKTAGRCCTNRGYERGEAR